MAEITDDSILSHYSSYVALDSKEEPNGSEKTNTQNEASSDGQSKEDAEPSDRRNSTTSPSMAQPTPSNMHRPPSHRPSSQSEATDGYAESTPAKHELTLTPSSTPSSLQFPLAIRDKLEQQQLMAVNSEPDSPASLSTLSQILQDRTPKFPLTSTPIMNQSDVFAVPRLKKKKMNDILDIDGFRKASADALCAELKKLIETNRGAQRQLFVCQRSYFSKAVTELDAQWEELYRHKEEHYAEIEEDRKWVKKVSEELEKEQKKLEEKMKENAREEEELAKAREAFNREKIEENAKIAQMRSNIKQANTQRVTKESKEKITELEEKVAKLTETALSRNRTISDLRSKLSREEKLREEAQKNADAHEKAIKDLKTMRKKLSDAHTENCNLRVQLSSARERLRRASSANTTASEASFNVGSSGRTNASVLRPQSAQTQPWSSMDNIAPSSNSDTAAGARKRVHWSSTLTRSRSASDLTQRQSVFTMPGPSSRNTFHDLVNTKYQYTSQGSEYTFQNGLNVVVVTELKCSCKTVKKANGDITWIYQPAAEMLQVNYFAQSGTFEILTPKKHRILLFADKQFELHYPNGNRTLILPTGKRLEMFVTEDEDEMGQAIRCFELYEDGNCIRWTTVDDPVEVVPNEKQSVPCGDETVNFITLNDSVSINTSDIRMRRVNESGYVKIYFVKNCPPLQLTLCPVDGVLIVQHIVSVETNGSKLKKLCYGLGQCNHTSASAANS